MFFFSLLGPTRLDLTIDGAMGLFAFRRNYVLAKEAEAQKNKQTNAGQIDKPSFAKPVAYEKEIPFGTPAPSPATAPKSKGMTAAKPVPAPAPKIESEPAKAAAEEPPKPKRGRPKKSSS